MRGRLSRHVFLTTVFIALAIKLWLTSDFAMIPVLGPHDESNFLEHAKWIALGHWFGPYDNLALIKGPSLPLFLAVTREFGIPFPLAHQLLYFVACFVTCRAIRPLLRDERLLAGAFVFLFFNPDTFDQLSRIVYRSLIGSSFTLLTFSCAVALLLLRDRPVRTLWPWSVGLGVAFSAFWLNREEGIWLVPALAIVLLPSAILAFREARTGAYERALTIVAPFCLWGLSIAAITLINARVYGWPMVVEVQTPEFVSAYSALARISHPPADPRAPVPKSALAIAYAISPAAAELRKTFEGAEGAGWQEISCETYGSCTDIAGGWFLWTFRSAVAAAGQYRSADSARQYYRRLSDEIDRACDSHRIGCERKRLTLTPPIHVSQIPILAHNFRAGLFSFATWDTFAEEPADASASPQWLVDDYLFVTNSLAVGYRRHDFQGWLVTPGIVDFDVTASGQHDSNSIISRTASPDVAEALKKNGVGSEARFARFSIVTDCPSDCAVRVTEPKGKSFSIPLDLKKIDYRRSGTYFHLDSDSVASDVAATTKRKDGITLVIAALYQHGCGWMALLALLALVARSAPPPRLPIADHSIVAIALLTSLLLVIAILTVIQTLSFPGFSVEYFGSPHPLLLLFIVVVVAYYLNRWMAPSTS